MAIRDQDDMGYRTAITPKSSTIPVSRDETNYDTLKNVHDIFVETVDGLYKEFNAFDINKKDLPSDRMKKLLHQVEVNQGVYDVLSPLIERMENAMNDANIDFKKRNS